MKSLSLRWRLLLWSSMASVLTLALVVLLVDVSFRSEIRSQLDESLLFALQVAEEAWASQVFEQSDMTANLALGPLRAAVASGDGPTIRQTLNEVAPAAGWSAVVTADAGVLAATQGAPVQALQNAQALVEEAMYFHTADVWQVGGYITRVGAAALLFGGEPIAVLVTGEPVEAEEVTALEALVGRGTAIVTDARPTFGSEAGRLDQQAASELAEWAARPDQGLELVALGGERFVTVANPIRSNEGDRLGTLVLLASYDEALAPSNRLRAILIVILVLGLGVTFGVSGLFSKGITVPVGRLLRETERLAAGDLDQPIVPVRDDEIGRLATSFDEMRTSLNTARSELIRVERLSAIGQAASAVAHDFTQPLSTIAGAIGLLRMDDSNPDARERCFRAIESELDRLGRMKQEIVEFARGEASLETASIKFDSFLENTVSGLREGLSHEGVIVRVEHGYSGDWCIDSYRLGRVIENLIRNSASAEARSINLCTAFEGGELIIRLDDDGTGIPADLIDEIFEPFVTHGKKEGTGLGLAIARNVVGQHGGTIDVESAPGRTLFTIRLPAAEPTVPAPALATA
ncbi:MAG: HAMP domain-containing sensor histidine kinase [Gemmatimonadota bacterium]